MNKLIIKENRTKRTCDFIIKGARCDKPAPFRCICKVDGTKQDVCMCEKHNDITLLEIALDSIEKRKALENLEKNLQKLFKEALEIKQEFEVKDEEKKNEQKKESNT